jgi:hypothetical protein
MNETESKTGASRVDMEQLERTLQASIRLMKRGRREIGRMRRKPDHQARSDHGHGAS